MSRIGLGRRRPIADDAGDPLDGLVNLFDVGMILAIAFLIAGLGITLNLKTDKFEARQGKRASGQSKVIPTPRTRRKPAAAASRWARSTASPTAASSTSSTALTAVGLAAHLRPSRLSDFHLALAG